MQLFFDADENGYGVSGFLVVGTRTAELYLAIAVQDGISYGRTKLSRKRKLFRTLCTSEASLIEQQSIQATELETDQVIWQEERT